MHKTNLCFKYVFPIDGKSKLKKVKRFVWNINAIELKELRIVLL